MPASNATQSAILQLIFENIAFANVGNAAGLQPSAVAGSLYIALHTANPGATGTQSTSEAAYTGYARLAVSRASGSWTLSGNSPTLISNAAEVQFPMATGGNETETYFSIGLASTGAGQILVYGPLTQPLAVSNGIQPYFAVGVMQASAQ